MTVQQISFNASIDVVPSEQSASARYQARVERLVDRIDNIMDMLTDNIDVNNLDSNMIKCLNMTAKFVNCQQRALAHLCTMSVKTEQQQGKDQQYKAFDLSDALIDDQIEAIEKILPSVNNEAASISSRLDESAADVTTPLGADEQVALSTPPCSDDNVTDATTPPSPDEECVTPDVAPASPNLGVNPSTAVAQSSSETLIPEATTTHLSAATSLDETRITQVLADKAHQPSASSPNLPVSISRTSLESNNGKSVERKLVPRPNHGFRANNNNQKNKKKARKGK